MAERLRCAVIGAGAIGLEHLSSLSQCLRATAVAIAETSPTRAKEAADRFKLPRIYSDYRELLEQADIDAVTIALPNYLHAPVAIEALKARKHVLLEKPMAMNAREASRVIDTAMKMKRTLMVGQNFRFTRATQMAKLLIQRGDLGDIYHARCFWLRRSGIPRIGSWFTQKKYAGGGCIFDIGVHVLDRCLYLMGEFDAAAVSGQTFAKFGPRGLGDGNWGKSEIDPGRPFDVDDLSIALIKLKSGRTVLLEAPWAAHGPLIDVNNTQLFGTEAGLSLPPVKLFKQVRTGYIEEQVDPLPPLV